MNMYRIFDRFMDLPTCIDSRFPSQLGAYTDLYALVLQPLFLPLDIPPAKRSC